MFPSAIAAAGWRTPLREPLLCIIKQCTSIKHQLHSTPLLRLYVRYGKENRGEWKGIHTYLPSVSQSCYLVLIVTQGSRFPILHRRKPRPRWVERIVLSNPTDQLQSQDCHPGACGSKSWVLLPLHLSCILCLQQLWSCPLATKSLEHKAQLESPSDCHQAR